MPGRFSTAVLLLAMLTPLACANFQGTSKIKDPASFPPGRYGLYELESGRLILTHELKADETFGFEYRGNQPTALTIDRRTDRSDEAMSVAWRVPLKPTDYRWRRLATPLTTAPTAVVSER